MLEEARRERDRHKAELDRMTMRYEVPSSVAGLTNFLRMGAVGLSLDRWGSGLCVQIRGQTGELTLCVCDPPLLRWRPVEIRARP